MRQEERAWLSMVFLGALWSPAVGAVLALLMACALYLGNR